MFIYVNRLFKAVCQLGENALQLCVLLQMQYHVLNMLGNVEKSVGIEALDTYSNIWNGNQ